jgi:nucleoid-associated protein YgaU/DNA-binding SARP family transcriptional activator
MTPPSTRASRLVRAGVALIALAVFVVGVPVFLATAVGWPLPRAWPDPTAVRDALSGQAPIDTFVWFAVLACIGWLMWARVTLAVTAEVVAVVRQRPAPTRTGVHAAIGPLVAAITLALTVSATRLQAAPLLPPLTLIAATVDQQPPPVPSTTPAMPNAPLTWTVARNDSLWTIAEQTLGDPFRWRDIFTLNRDRPQPNGRRLRDPGIIEAGWILELPADADVSAAGDDVVIVQPGDTLSAIAQHELGDANAYPEVFDLNVGVRQPDGDHLHDPDLIRPGWHLDLPLHDADASASEEHVDPGATADNEPSTAVTTPPLVDAVPVPSPAATEPTTNVTSPAPVPSTDRRGPLDAGPLGIAGGLLAAALGARWEHRRRHQRQQRQPGERVPALPTAVAPVAAELLGPASPGELVPRLLATLADAMADAVPRLVQVSEHRVEVLMSRAANPPPGWAPDADGIVWTHPLRDTALVDEDRLPLFPALIAVGATDEDGVLLNLDHETVVAVTGDDDGAAALLASIMLELGDDRAGATVAAVGPSVPVLEGGGLVRFDDVGAARDTAQRMTSAVSAALRAAGVDTIAALRAHCPDDRFDSLVFVLSASDCAAAPAVVAELEDLAAQRLGFALVTIGTARPGACELKVADGTVALASFGLVCAVQQVPPETITALAELSHTAELGATAPPAAEQPELFPHGEPDSALPPAPGDSDMCVRVLGPISVDCVDRLAPQHIALLAFLIINPNATADAVQHALWAGHRPARERFANTIHELRKAIGADRFPAAVDGRYRLVGVDSDLGRFARRQQDGDVEGALALVTGPPLTYDGNRRRHFTWVDLGNHATRLEAIIADTAHTLARESLDRGDTRLAVFAAQQGLLASPNSEALTRDLLAAHVAAGDRTMAARVLAEYERALEDISGGEPPAEFYDLVEP